ncbi:hypothetical protein GCM10023232_13370 [Sphingosinicella ginsenosidimutans]|uniref:Uncharacterized protein n=1 Tax=Allosphingosinicella ginsenosidimutans TaxID=1176539 RepID=A0A5C6TR00_9SPHN|nr:hypothetical protein [Sphingosinicella ginsenosidimutans]TXC62431.1 hypothetical protein FRZ32_01430 [Sphingosinicella ginsenosidimutans]
MHKLISLILAGAAIAATPAAAADRRTPEQQLAHALEGRVAGDPVDCVNLPQVRSTQIIPGTAIIYDAGGTLYVNRPRSGAEQLNNWNTLVTRLSTTQLCSIDTIQLVDRSSHMLSGIVFLGEFVPYRRPQDAH